MTSRSFYSIIDYMKDKDLNEIHRHHIVPRYRCKELGIDPDFDDNLIDITRLIHAEIHWGYYCSDLSPLLEVCNPPQYVLDMIPLGDNRDVGAATILALGEIDDIDSSGENNPNYKTGKYEGRLDNPELYKKRDKEDFQENWPKRRSAGCPRMMFLYHKKESGNEQEMERHWNLWYKERAKIGFKSKNRQSLWETDTFKMWRNRKGNDLNFR